MSPAWMLNVEGLRTAAARAYLEAEPDAVFRTTDVHVSEENVVMVALVAPDDTLAWAIFDGAEVKAITPFMDAGE